MFDVHSAYSNHHGQQTVRSALFIAVWTSISESSSRVFASVFSSLFVRVSSSRISWRVSPQKARRSVRASRTYHHLQRLLFWPKCRFICENRNQKWTFRSSSKFLLLFSPTFGCHRTAGPVAESKNCWLLSMQIDVQRTSFCKCCSLYKWSSQLGKRPPTSSNFENPNNFWFKTLDSKVLGANIQINWKAADSVS